MSGANAGVRIEPGGAAWSCAANAALYIDDPGPDRIEIGSLAEPHLVSRYEAWVEFYSRCLLVDLDADPELLDDAIAASRDWVAGGYLGLLRAHVHSAVTGRGPSPGSWSQLRPAELRAVRRVQHLALELAVTARKLVTAAGADDDPRAQQRLLLGMRHAVTDEVLGALMSAEQRSENAAELAMRLSEADDPG